MRTRLLCGALSFAFVACNQGDVATVPSQLASALTAPACRAELGVIDCGGVCRNTERDPMACGGCGVECAPGDQCVEGICRAERIPVSPSRKPDPGTWSQRSPNYGGRISSVAVKSGDANSIAVASPGGGVWFTSNNGTSWSQPYVSGGIVSYLGDFSDVHLEWDRATAGRLFLQTRSDIYATSNFGSTWSNLTGRGMVPAPLMPNTSVTNATDSRPFTQMVLSGGTRIVLAAQPCNGILYSYDGSTFTQSWPFTGGATNPDNCIQTIAGDDPSGFVYFATQAEPGTGAAHVFASTSAWTSTTPSLSWTSANGSLPTGLGAISLADTADYGGGTFYPKNLAALLIADSGSSSSRVWLTGNGSTWSAATAFPSSSWSMSTIDYPGQNQLFAGTVYPYQSPNTYGSTWAAFSGGSDHPDFRAFYWDNALGYLWAGNDGGNQDGSLWNLSRWSWTIGGTPSSETRVPTTGTNGLPIWQAYAMAVTSASSSSGRRAYLALQDNGGACSDDAGVTWNSYSAPAGGDVASIVFAPSSPGVAYARGDESNPVHTSNANAASCSAVTWSTCGVSTIPSPFWTEHMTAVHPTNPSKVYFTQQALGGSVLISSDGCATGTNSAALPGYPISIYVDGSGNIYVGTLGHGAYVSTNNGASWSNWALNSSPPVAVLSIAWSSAGGGAGTFYLATTNGLYQLLPGGSWTVVAGGSGYTVSDVAVDPHCSSKVYAAFGYVGNLGSHRGGILYSNNNGTSWTSITSGLTLHQGPIANVQVDPVSTEFVWAASFGLGGWRYDSGSTSCP